MAKIKPKNVRIGQADTFLFGLESEAVGICELFATDANISLRRSVDGSTFLMPSKNINLLRVRPEFKVDSLVRM